MSDIKELTDRQKEIKKIIDKCEKESSAMMRKFWEDRAIINKELDKLRDEQEEVFNILRDRWDSEFAVKGKLFQLGVTYLENGYIRFEDFYVYKMIDRYTAISYSFDRKSISISKYPISTYDIQKIMTQGKEITIAELEKYINMVVGDIDIPADVK